MRLYNGYSHMGKVPLFFVTETEILINLFFIHYLKKKKIIDFQPGVRGLP